MSIIPQEDLRAVNDFNLPTFTISQSLDGKDSFVFDSYTLYDSFWKSITIRNFSNGNILFYRETPNSVLDQLPPLAERTLTGWGSYFDCEAPGSTTLEGILIFELVKRMDAFKRG